METIIKPAAEKKRNNKNKEKMDEFKMLFSS
jgi:hypothetical protein